MKEFYRKDLVWYEMLSYSSPKVRDHSLNFWLALSQFKAGFLRDQ